MTTTIDLFLFLSDLRPSTIMEIFKDLNSAQDPDLKVMQHLYEYYVNVHGTDNNTLRMAYVLS